jgi:hypothetical protein
MRVGLPDRYVTHGAPKLLHEEVGFTGERIAQRILAAVGEGPETAEDPGAEGVGWTGRITGARP